MRSVSQSTVVAILAPESGICCGNEDFTEMKIKIAGK